jgi:hypothetical protein
MSLDTVITIIVLVTAFTVFGVALVWADYKTRPAGHS